MAYDEAVAARVRTLVHSRTGISERKMFGGLAFMAHGHMFIGVQGSTLMVRVGPDAYANALTKPCVREMDFTGRPMKGYVYVEPGGFASDEAIAHWVNASHAFAATLPPKKSG